MSRELKGGSSPGHGLPAPVFATLGDEPRLRLIGRLCNGDQLSLSELSQGTRLTRQAVTKHLRVLENARLVQGMRLGRKTRFRFPPGPFEETRKYLELVSGQWERALARLKLFVESAAGKH
jgi:DNA-binding transcriptional ArsR family regulator